MIKIFQDIANAFNKKDKNLSSDSQTLYDEINKKMVFYHLYTQFAQNNPPQKLQNTHKFLLFNYSSHHRFKHYNLGDYIQTIAVKNALDTIFSNNKYEFFDRDRLNFYNGGGGGTSHYARLVCSWL